MTTENIDGSDDRLKELKPQVKEKALSLAAEYQKKGMNLEEALQKGIVEAEEWFTKSEG